jgi:hypothetical protein
MKRVLLLAAPLLGLLVPRAADACAPVPCYATQSFVLPRAGSIPANAPGIALFEGRTIANAPARTLSFQRTDGASPVDVPFTRDGGVIRPDQPFVEGASYRFVITNNCSTVAMPSDSSEFKVGPSAPLPTTLGQLAVARKSGVLKVDHASACSADVGLPHAEIEIQLSAAAAPWKELIVFRTFVDGERWGAREETGQVTHPGGSWKGPGKDVVYARCSDSPNYLGGVKPGKHTIVMKGTIPGTDVALETAAVEVDLDCSNPQIGDITPDRDQLQPKDEGDDMAKTGCSASPAGAASAPFAALVLGLSVVITRRVRRR